MYVVTRTVESDATSESLATDPGTGKVFFDTAQADFTSGTADPD
ncbi:hypothetical protein LCGC14_1741010, partial [marine sediment metagenome]